MSLIFAESFDAGYTSTTLMTSGRYHPNSTMTGGHLNTTNGRNGKGWGQSDTYGGAIIYRRLAAAEADDLLIVGLARYMSNHSNTNFNHTMLEFRSGVTATSIGFNQVYLSWDHTSRSIMVYRGDGVLLGQTGNLASILDSWRYFEVRVRCSNTIGTVDIRMDGASLLSLGTDTLNAGSTLLDCVGIGAGSYAGSGWFSRIDDIYICNEQGTTNNDWLGDIRVEALLPNGDGANSDFTAYNYNRLPNVNVSGIETDASGWLVETNANTLERVTTPVHAGLGSTGALKVTSTANGNVVIKTVGGTAGAPVRSGYSYVPAVYGRADTTGRNYQLAIDWYDAAGTFLSRSPNNITSVDTTTYAQKAGALALAPNAAAFASLVLQIDGPIAGEIHYIDDAFISEAAAIPDPGANPSTSHSAAVGDLNTSAGGVTNGWDLSYLLGGTDNQIDTFAFTNPVSPVTKPVKGVVVFAQAKTDTPSAKSLALVARGTGGTEATSDDRALSQVWGANTGVSAGFDADPGDGAWTVTSLGTAEFGVKVRP